ncbi:hypothetical protein [Photorhabdus heterorhabditis]|uniref:hypothetical protein n=1 Tax=Photorhabdus heterorhabditis TaxID=880156 RepID=UPI0030D6E96C
MTYQNFFRLETLKESNDIVANVIAGATSLVVTAALSTTAIAIGVFIIGALVVWGLMWLDDEFKISETIIKRLKEHKVKTPISPYHPDQIFNALGRYYRG